MKPAEIDDLKQKAIRGGFAKVGGQGIGFVLRVGSLMVLARLLDPRDFGLVGMVTAVTGALSLLKDFGLSSATIQRASITDEQVSTLFWINMAVGTLLCLILTAAAPFLAAFYREPRLATVTVVLATGFVFNAAGVQHSGLLQRQMRFTALTVADVVSLVSSIAIGIVLAVNGFGYWALVAMTVSAPLVATACMWLAAPWLPGRPRRHTGVGSMIRFGGTVTLNGLVVYVAYNLDKVLLGRVWGAAAVGIYGRAYQLITIPTENLNSAVGGVAFSALSRVQHDPERFRSYFLKGYSLVLALTIFATAACVLLADDLIAVLLGPKWAETTAIFKLLAPTILIFAMINPLGWLMIALGMVGRSLRIALVLAPLVIVGYVAGLPYGPKGVAFGYSAMMTLWVIPHVAWCVHRTPVSFRDVARAVARPFLSIAPGVGLVLGIQLLDRATLSAPGRLALEGTVLLASYVVMLLYVMGQKSFYVDLLGGLRWRPAAADTLARA